MECGNGSSIINADFYFAGSNHLIHWLHHIQGDLHFSIDQVPDSC